MQEVGAETGRGCAGDEGAEHAENASSSVVLVVEGEALDGSASMDLAIGVLLVSA